PSSWLSSSWRYRRSSVGATAESPPLSIGSQPRASRRLWGRPGEQAPTPERFVRGGWRLYPVVTCGMVSPEGARLILGARPRSHPHDSPSTKGGRHESQSSVPVISGTHSHLPRRVSSFWEALAGRQ